MLAPYIIYAINIVISGSTVASTSYERVSVLKKMLKKMDKEKEKSVEAVIYSESPKNQLGQVGDFGLKHKSRDNCGTRQEASQEIKKEKKQQVRQEAKQPK